MCCSGSRPIWRPCTASSASPKRRGDPHEPAAVPLRDWRGWHVTLIRSVIRGVGAYLPKRIMTNDDLARLVDTSDAWIRERTGIEQRHVAEEGELTSDLGIAASRQALVRAGIDPVDIDLVICATS